ncbi:hypothetical protein ACFL6C_01220 [Myxococcota bacterium]
MKLSSVAIEARNAHSLCIALIEQGWIPAKPDYDEGVDLMAWHEKRGKTRAIQLKGRLTVAKKYLGRGIWLAFPASGWWYMVSHDWVLEQKPEVKKTKSWKHGGEYNWPRLTAEWSRKLKPYRFAKAR